MDGVVSVHELHVWQLSDIKLIASLHVLLRSRESYITLSSEIRKLLHGYGIHSATIQPEFIEDQYDEKKVYQIDEDPNQTVIHVDGIEDAPRSLHALSVSNNDSFNEVREKKNSNLQFAYMFIN